MNLGIKIKFNEYSSIKKFCLKTSSMEMKKIKAYIERTMERGELNNLMAHTVLAFCKI